ncbi:hypothetical protein [Lentisalinibacter salinarum]|uniref:hypothetical protein n=1 Tax=Lentisalinibacter salinarum TaxID=2992239 RepID=UPI00386BEDD0
MPARPLRYPLALTVGLTLTLTAFQALATRDAAKTLFPVPPAHAADAAAPTPVTPPVLRVRPLIELRWAEIFGDRIEGARRGAQRAMDRSAAFPPIRLPTGPMYRRDI